MGSKPNQFIAIFVVVAGLTGSAHGGPLVEYELDNNFAGGVLTSNVISSNLSEGFGLSGTFSNFSPKSGSHSIIYRGDETEFLDPHPITSGDWLEFTIQPENGYKLRFDSVTWWAAGRDISDNGDFTVRTTLYWDVDTYAGNVGTHDLAVTSSTASYSQGISSFPSTQLTDPVTFRLTIGSSAGWDSQVSLIDLVQVNGEVAAMPEPSSFLVMTGVSVLVFAYRVVRRRRQAVG